MFYHNHKFIKIVGTFVLAIFICACKDSGLSVAKAINISEVPSQKVENMSFIKSENGRILMKVTAPLMEKFDNDSLSYDLFPKGVTVYNYDSLGHVQSTIRANKARHDLIKNKENSEKWYAYGNVVIHNIEKKETMQTDTLYWNKAKHEIYTNCYVKLFSPSGLMQGYGMRSNERADDAVILKPFDSFTIIKERPKIKSDSNSITNTKQNPKNKQEVITKQK